MMAHLMVNIIIRSSRVNAPKHVISTYYNAFPAQSNPPTILALVGSLLQDSLHDGPHPSHLDLS